MVNRADHGVIFSLENIEQAVDRAWAPQSVQRNGKHYLYCPVHKKDGGMAIAVGVSENPTGPFKDLGQPLVDEGAYGGGDCFTNHAGIADFKGRSYLFYHT